MVVELKAGAWVAVMDGSGLGSDVGIAEATGRLGTVVVVGTIVVVGATVLVVGVEEAARLGCAVGLRMGTTVDFSEGKADGVKSGDVEAGFPLGRVVGDKDGIGESKGDGGDEGFAVDCPMGA
mmetsp:Transcript_4771/g.6572  ORF Transcript_4771/g.6572 Transcript_4771/m.6572 type:complete len:123 (+) Transcript_4771:940-1308(+)